MMHIECSGHELMRTHCLYMVNRWFVELIRYLEDSSTKPNNIINYFLALKN